MAKPSGKSTDKEIVIPQPKLQQMAIRIVGITPLLTNRFGEKAIEQIEVKQQHDAKGPREARDPHADFQAACHLISPGVYGFPASGIKKAFVAAGFRFADEKGTVLRGVLNVTQPLIVIEGPEPRMRTDPVRLPTGKFTIAYRPEFNPWAMTIPVVYNAAMISPAQILNLVQIAGFSVGIGAWRPETNGSFGQFSLDENGMALA